MASFPSQVRIAYLGLLVAGLWLPLHFIYWIEFAGTSAMVLYGYCFMARCLSLLPFNRRLPFTISLLTRTFLSPPVKGTIVSVQRTSR